MCRQQVHRKCRIVATSRHFGRVATKSTLIGGARNYAHQCPVTSHFPGHSRSRIPISLRVNGRNHHSDLKWTTSLLTQLAIVFSWIRNQQLRFLSGNLHEKSNDIEK